MQSRLENQAAVISQCWGGLQVRNCDEKGSFHDEKITDNARISGMPWLSIFVPMIQSEMWKMMGFRGIWNIKAIPWTTAVDILALRFSETLHLFLLNYLMFLYVFSFHLYSAIVLLLFFLSKSFLCKRQSLCVSLIYFACGCVQFFLWLLMHHMGLDVSDCFYLCNVRKAVYFDADVYTPLA